MYMIALFCQFYIQSAFMAFHLVLFIMDSKRIRHHQTVISPFLSELIHNFRILVNPFAIYTVIAAHDRPWIRFFQDQLKYPKVQFIQCTFIHNRISCHPLVFLIVAYKML